MDKAFEALVDEEELTKLADHAIRSNTFGVFGAFSYLKNKENRTAEEEVSYKILENCIQKRFEEIQASKEKARKSNREWNAEFAAGASIFLSLMSEAADCFKKFKNL